MQFTFGQIFVHKLDTHTVSLRYERANDDLNVNSTVIPDHRCHTSSLLYYYEPIDAYETMSNG